MKKIKINIRAKIFFLICFSLLISNKFAIAQFYLHPTDTNIYEMSNAFWNNYNGELDNGEDNIAAQFRRFESFWMPRLSGHGGNFRVANQASNDFQNSLNQQPLIAPPCLSANWSPKGPSDNVGAGIGRMACLAFSPFNPDIIYGGAPIGGVWKYSKVANQWTVLNTDTKLARLGVTSIAINPTLNPVNGQPIIYAATGDFQYSHGVYRSMSGGNTWYAINGGDMSDIYANGALNQVYQLLIDPLNSTDMYAATSLGIYKCINRQASAATLTWSHIYPVGGQEPIGSIAFDPNDPFHNTLYACGWTVVKTTNAGATWASVAVPGSGLDLSVYPFNSPAFPNACVQGSKLSVAGNNKFYILLVVQTLTCPHNWQGCTSYYFFEFSFLSQLFTPRNSFVSPCNAGGRVPLTVSPLNSSIVYAGDVSYYKSINSGGSWSSQGSCNHVDHHFFIFDPINNTDLYICNDGGVSKVNTLTGACTELNNGLEIAAIYNIASSVQDPEEILAGTQDDGAKYLKNGLWKTPYLSDNFEELIDYADTRNMLTTPYRTLLWNVTDDINPSFSGGVHPSGQYGGAWATGFNLIQDPFQSNILYFGGHDVWKSSNFTFGNSNFNSSINNGTTGNWLRLSDFVTYYSADPSQEIISLKVAPTNPSIIYVVLTSFGAPSSVTARVFKTTVGGGINNWTDVTPPGIGNTTITDVEISSIDPQHIWVTFSGYDPNLKVKESVDGGINWQDRYIGLPNLPVNCIEYEQGSNDGVYIGLDVGVFYKDNTMQGWATFKNDCSGGNAIPNTIVNELEINYSNNKMRAGTYGRSVWESSNLVCPAQYNLTLTGTVSANDWQEAQNDIYSTQNVQTGTVFNRGGNAVELNPGFIADATANSGLIYKAFIHSCNMPYNSPMPLPRLAALNDMNSDKDELKKELKKPAMEIVPNPNTGIFNIHFKNLDTISMLHIYNSFGTEVKNVLLGESGTSVINLTGLPKGIYYIRLENKEISDKIVKKVIIL